MAHAPGRDRGRKLETGLAGVTLAVLPPYFVLETWSSLPYGLADPFYLVDAIAMALLLAGALHSLRRRPARAPGLLCAAYGWAAANGLRATSWRLKRLAEGGTLDHGLAEAVLVTGASAAALVLFATLIALQVRVDSPDRGRE